MSFQYGEMGTNTLPSLTLDTLDDADIKLLARYSLYIAGMLLPWFVSKFFGFG